MKQSKEFQNHCHISGTITDKTTGERRQLTDEELAAMFEKILAIPPAERVRMGFRRMDQPPEE